MPPKKKSKSSSSSTSSAKKNHQNSQQQQQQQQQPSKFGIQHFFNLHTQNALSLSQNPQPPPTPPIPQTLSQNPIISPNSLNPKFAPPSDSHHLDADDNVMDVSPEITKSVSLQRFKFSPGMVLFIFLRFLLIN
jgi:DNA replication ATP-dependent helicase Dna2